MAEVEICCLMRYGLPARVADYEEFEQLHSAWESDRNERARTVDWRFTVDDARQKLSRLYLKIELEESVNWA